MLTADEAWAAAGREFQAELARGNTVDGLAEATGRTQAYVRCCIEACQALEPPPATPEPRPATPEKFTTLARIPPAEPKPRKRRVSPEAPPAEERISANGREWWSYPDEELLALARTGRDEIRRADASAIARERRGW